MDRLERSAMVRLTISWPWRTDSCRRMARGDLRLGTMSIYMGTHLLNIYQIMINLLNTSVGWTEGENDS